MFNSITKADVRDVVRGVLEDVLKSDDQNIENRKRLEKEVADLKKQITELEHKKSLEEKEIAHLVKMKEEKIFIETKKKELELREQYMVKEAELQQKFHEQTVALLEKHQAKFQETYQEIMKRLPNVNVEISKGGR